MFWGWTVTPLQMTKSPDDQDQVDFRLMYFVLFFNYRGLKLFESLDFSEQ